MKVDKIFYQKVFPLSPYVNEKIGVEIIIEQGETAQQGLNEAKAIVERWHKESNVALPPATGPDGLPVINREEDRLEMLIENAKTVDELAKYKERATSERLQKVYMNKLKTLIP